MFKHKKITAFIMSILICACAGTAPLFSAFAENESSSAETTEEGTAEAATEEATDAPDPDNDWITSGDYSYSVTRSGEICIEKYNGSEKNVVIPEELGGMSVAELGSKAFFESSVETIEIHAGIDYISANNPFLECNSLKEINVAQDNAEYSSVDGILFSKDGKKLLHYPVGKEASSYSVPDGVEELGIAAIYSTKLTEIIIPTSVKTLNRHALSYNTKLASIDLSETKITSLGIMSLSYCTALTKVKFPSELIEIEGGAFAGCSSLKTISLPDTLYSVGQNAFAGTALEQVRIPPSVMEIGYCAFGYDEELKPIDSFIIIGAASSAAQMYAFDTDADYEYANNFTFMTYEQAESQIEFDNEEPIVYGDFLYSTKNGEVYITACTSIESRIEVPAEIDGMPVVSIYGGAFFQNTTYNVILPDTIRIIDNLAFYYCTNLRTITIQDGVTEIREQAFSNCSSLEAITIPGTCKVIGNEAFFGCIALKEFKVSDADGGNYTAENGVLFSKDKSVLIAYPPAKPDTEYTVPGETKEIALSAFIFNKYLEDVDISTVITIDDYAFENCEKLKSVKLSEDLEKVGMCAFYNCRELKSVRLYNKIKEIGAVAFGFYYDETIAETTEQIGGISSDIPVEGFKIYADKNSIGHEYAKSAEIKCVHGTISFLGFNMEKGFFYVLIGAVSALVLGIIGFITGKALKKKKKAKSDANPEENTQNKLEDNAEETDTEAEETDNDEEAERKDNNDEA